jgi:hypothetical protein
MALPTASFVGGVLVLAYLSTFVLFALVRILTGISIQRIGYSGLRRIAYSPRDGVKMYIRGIGLSLHRPTFAHPTCISLHLTEPQVIVDLSALDKSPSTKQNTTTHGASQWKQLTDVKNKIKKLHSKIRYLSLIDLVAVSSSLVIKDVGTITVERITLAVDTRPKTVDRSRLFQHDRTKASSLTPAEWKSVVRSILFTPEAKESSEILDGLSLSVHGFLNPHLEGLRDASIALKLGRLDIPYDDLLAATEKVHDIRGSSKHHYRNTVSMQAPKIAVNDVLEEPQDTGSREEKLMHAVAESRDFISSVLKGIQEFQLAIGFLGLSKRIQSLHTTGQNVYFNMAMKELGMDLLRLDPRSPAHRMYFSPQDVAHQALLTAISISAGVDDGHDHPERMLYVPMLTATVKTTLPSKTIKLPDTTTNDRERNSNILFANLVCTSPSVDVDPKHLPLLLAIAKVQKESKKSSRTPLLTSRGFISKLLPKAIIKIAVQEPVVRCSLPPLNPLFTGDVEYDLIISTTSTMSLDIDSQHSSTDSAVKYGLNLNYRQTSSQLYYQTNEGHKHDLLQTETIELKIDVNVLPQPEVFVYGRFQTFSFFLVRTEISEGIRQIVKAARRETVSDDQSTIVKKPSFLRQIPAWLQHVSIQGADFNVELAGVDPAVSKYARGFALQLESWSVEYKAHREESYIPPSRRRSLTRSFSREKNEKSSTSEAPRKKQSLPTDGRRLAVHIQGLEGHIIDTVQDSAADSFITLPKFEVAFSTSSDVQGPLFHINSHAKSLQLKYSLYKHFSIGVAILTFRRMFLTLEKRPADGENHASNNFKMREDSKYDQILMNEVTTLDFKANLIQVKAEMPSDPPLMIQVFGIDCGRHRWATPFARLKIIRLLAGTPNMRQVWSRIVSVKNLRLDLREMKHKVGQKTEIAKSFDLTTDVIRIGVPHGMVLHAIFDNIVNTVKTCEQLHHHFSTGTNEYILEKHPEGPKKVPRISLRSQLLLFEIEDSGFEWKLGTIYRAGLLEQQQRLAREEAFRLKIKTMEWNRQRRGSSRVRTASAQPLQSRKRSLSRPTTANNRRSKSSHSIHTLREESEGSPERHRGRGRDRKLRYNTEGKADMNGANTRTIEKAHAKLQEFNAESWKKRIDRALGAQSHALKELRGLMWGMNDLPEDLEQSENIMAIPQRPALMAAIISDVGVIIDKPSFALDQYPQFLHDVGKGLPMDMKYGLLLPMSLRVTMGEARCMLRDYPLPLMHVPAIRSGQSPRLASLSLSTDFVVAEEFQGEESQRHINVVVVPKEKLGKDDVTDKFAIDVRRTISAVKTYSNMKIDINTSSPTRITWGTSYQPAIQDMMQVIENFTKPPMDPSERVGFWDKIRLSFHSRLDVNWKGDGDVHLCLKGSRNPYVVTGLGAGFVMVWRNQVRMRIAQDDDPRKFLTVDSGDYVLAIPDYNYYARQVSEDEVESTGGSSSVSSGKATAAFKKVIMKLSGNVQWMAGLTFEHELEGNKRSFDFCPHYKIKLMHPDYAKAPPGGVYDAFKGFRSHWIHGSIAISAPQDRDWNVANLQPSKNYNSVHLTPRFFTHFYDWWSLFSGVMSLPVRQGPLWGSMEKTSKKFGRHLGTIKYNLLFSPLFISHIYKHKDAEDYVNDVVSATGLKMKLDSFMLDLHQRRETFEIPATAGKKAKRSTAMKMNQSQLDFISADIRAISASIKGTSATELDRADEATMTGYQANNITNVDMSKFTIPDNDLTWIDMDDFVELDWILPSETNPATKILPLGFAPRFTYFRQTDHGDSVSGDTTRSSIFGDEPTHYCVMSKRNDPRRVQADLIESRIHRIEEQMEHNERACGDQEVKVVRTHDGDESLGERLRALQNHAKALQKKHEFLTELLAVLQKKLRDEGPSVGERMDPKDLPDRDTEKEHVPKDYTLPDTTQLVDYSSDFNNRFVVHNAQIKWNNSLRNIILRYIHQVSQRRGFVYYMSRRAVKFILDILDEQKKSGPQAKADRAGSTVSNDSPSFPMTPNHEDEMAVQDRIDQLLNDGRQFVNADDPEKKECKDKSAGDGSGEGISTEYTPQNIYHFRLIAPQIQLQSEKNPKSVLLVAAKGMQLKVVQIMDKQRVLDEISGLVQTRFSASMDSMQIFIASTKTFSTEYLHMYSGNRYGGKVGEYWPPWVPLEGMFEFQVNPYGFSRVVHRTSASLRYDKHNNLRLKYNDDVNGNDGSKTQHPDATDDARMDHVYIEFPHFRAICDSGQYFSMYIIVLDLLLYSEPLEKTRSERLEKIMLASDFSDLTGAPEMVEMLQSRIRQLEDIKMHFQINQKLLDRQGWKDRVALDADLASCEDELFFMMKAITTSQRRNEDRGQDESPGLLRWLISSKEIAWHLIRGNDESLVEFQIKDALFDRTDNNDGSNSSCVEIGRINGFNLLPNAVYPEIIAPYIDPAKGYHKQHDMKMLRVQWLMLEAIAGIPVVDYFEVNVMPLRVQLEREIAKRLFEYLFPGVGGNAFEGKGGFSPFMVRNMAVPEDDDDSDDKPAPTNEATVTHGVGTGAGALEHRLQPTLKLPEARVPVKGGKGKGLGISSQGSSSTHSLHHWNPFTSSSEKSSANSAAKRSNVTHTTPPTASNPSLRSRSPSRRSSETNSLAESNNNNNNNNAEQLSKKKSGKKSKDKDKDEKRSSDDLSLMLSRASNYMTLSFFKVPSMVLCLSYKGQGRRNLEDVHDLVFRMPTLEYRNKTWSNLDLALQMKKDLIKALISHAGAIVGNKFSHHSKAGASNAVGGARAVATSKLREFVNSSVLVHGGNNHERHNSREDGSEMSTPSRIRDEGDNNDDDTNNHDAPARPSFTSGRPSTYGHIDDDYNHDKYNGSPVVLTRTKSITPSVKLDKESEGPVVDKRPGTSHSSATTTTSGTGGGTLSRKYTNASSSLSPLRDSGESKRSFSQQQQQQQYRMRTTSLGSNHHHYSNGNSNGEKKAGGFLGRFSSRPGTSDGSSMKSGYGGGGDGIEDNSDTDSFKSRLLLGGQKLLNKLPTSSSGGGGGR